MQTAEEINIVWGFRAIEIIQSVLNPLPKPELKEENFFFNIQVEQKIDAANKLIQVIVHIHIQSNEVENELASLSTLCMFYIENLDALIEKGGEKMQLPDHFINTLSSIAISTSRGIIFTLFRGTYLHRAILPIIDPTQLKPQIK